MNNVYFKFNLFCELICRRIENSHFLSGIEKVGNGDDENGEDGNKEVN